LTQEPIIVNLAKILFSVVPHAAKVERTFSLFDWIQSKRRNCLSAEKKNMTSFIKEWYTQYPPTAIGNNDKKSVVKKQPTVKHVKFEGKEKSSDVEINDKSILLDGTRSLKFNQDINESLSCTSTIATGSCPTSQEKDEGVIFMANFEEDREDDCSIIADEEGSVPLTPAGLDELLLTAALVEEETTTENSVASRAVPNTSTFGNAASWLNNQDTCLEQILASIMQAKYLMKIMMFWQFIFPAETRIA
jgi:hypothetical protein